MAKKKTVSRSNEERIIRVWDIEQIKDLMSRRTVYETNGQREEELRDLWVQLPENQKTASFGRNWGYYVGMDEIKRYYVTQYNEQVQAEIAKLPDVDVPGTGRFLFHPLSTPNVNLAEDGKTAQGTWYSIGADCYPAENGKADCNWNCQKICADFIKEPGGWKIWHVVFSNDFMNKTGHNVSELQSIYIRGTGRDEIDFGTPTIPMLAHDPSYTWCDNYPPLNGPYETFTDEISYGPEGHPNYEA